MSSYLILYFIVNKQIFVKQYMAGMQLTAEATRDMRIQHYRGGRAPSEVSCVPLRSGATDGGLKGCVRGLLKSIQPVFFFF